MGNILKGLSGFKKNVCLKTAVCFCFDMRILISKGLIFVCLFFFPIFLVYFFKEKIDKIVKGGNIIGQN